MTEPHTVIGLYSLGPERDFFRDHTPTHWTCKDTTDGPGCGAVISPGGPILTGSITAAWCRVCGNPKPPTSCPGCADPTEPHWDACRHAIAEWAGRLL